MEIILIARAPITVGLGPYLSIKKPATKPPIEEERNLILTVLTAISGLNPCPTRNGTMCKPMPAVNIPVTNTAIAMNQ